jgi:hypothetical protein
MLEVEAEERSTHEEDPQYIGQGLMTVDDLSSVEGLTNKLKGMGIPEKDVEFVIRTSYPKHHPQHLSKNSAAREVLEANNGLTAINRAYNTCIALVQELLFGKEARAIRQLTLEEQRKKETRQKRPRLPATEKARLVAIKQLGVQFRKENDLRVRGRIPGILKAEYDEFLAKHMDATVDAILAEMTKDDQKNPEISAETTEE